MSAKYKTDNYLLMGFDEYGGKLFTEITGPGLTGSRESGYERIASGDCASFAIARVLYNSIDAAKADRWMPKEKPIKLDPGPLGIINQMGTTYKLEGDQYVPHQGILGPQDFTKPSYRVEDEDDNLPPLIDNPFE